MAKHNRGKLTEEAKRWVIAELAAYEPPLDVARGVKERFGIEVSAQAIERYDPTKAAGAGLPEKYRVLFDLSREGFRTNVESVPIANKAVRLRRLQRIADFARTKGNVVLEADMLERAAKEMGEAYTNSRVVKGAVAVTGADGGPVEHEHRHTWNADEAVKDALGALAAEEG